MIQYCIVRPPPEVVTFFVTMYLSPFPLYCPHPLSSGNRHAKPVRQKTESNKWTHTGHKKLNAVIFKWVAPQSCQRHLFERKVLYSFSLCIVFLVISESSWTPPISPSLCVFGGNILPLATKYLVQNLLITSLLEDGINQEGMMQEEEEAPYRNGPWVYCISMFTAG